MNREDLNKRAADEVALFIIKNNYGYDTRIYFNDICYELSNNEITVLRNIKPSDYFEYANNDTVSMSFEGPLYNAMNGYSSSKIYNTIESIFNKYGYYMEMGNAWNIAVYDLP